MREHLVAMKSLLRGERVSSTGRYVMLDDVALEWPPPVVPPLYVGATGPKSMHLSGELADGTIIDAGNSAAAVRRMRAQIDEGRAAAGRTDPHQVVVYLTVTTGPDAVARLRAEKDQWGTSEIPELGAAGDAATVAEAVAALVDAGADTVIAVPTGDEPDLEALTHFIAKEVRPLVP
jgi:alkanesulfonate monooxygenase SsuD/methylene tetrahydromethanopterin reductase-like flavin-dependent oxidoreductase (luciferase family)